MNFEAIIKSQRYRELKSHLHVSMIDYAEHLAVESFNKCGRKFTEEELRERAKLIITTSVKLMLANGSFHLELTGEFDETPMA